MTHDVNDGAAVSPELDAMVGDVLGSFLDALAEGADPGVVVCLEDAQGNRYEAAFSEDGPEACLNGARQFVSQHAAGVPKDHVGPVRRYAIAYAGCVDAGGYQEDAVIASFYEQGLPSGFSAFVSYEGAGTGEGFRWADPQPAGEEEPLL